MCARRDIEDRAADAAPVALNVLITRHDFAPIARSHDRFASPRVDALVIAVLELTTY